ncbi:unnamed protein product [Cuscuta epithymum]|uniref:Chromo domain-containing protein n=1 Tax=Cuscuta epithymum TaxID=186058 RepID=A0AAV0FP77_9ASTE|nr:unnamed protein product [Cuscuta epithymum]
MGVKNLWDILDSCKKTLPLHHLQNKRVCIDLSCWMVQLLKVNISYSALKEKVYLRGLFHRLRALIALNCTVIFVTDGAIPAIKSATYRRRLKEDPNLQILTSIKRNRGSAFSSVIKEAKVLGKALGISCLDGIEEAEAQCALLNSESLCDGCFTSDSDAFLFGARTVYRDICLGEGGYVVCYEMDDIERKLGFGRNSLITLGVILGGDYSQGILGLGRESACQIVKSLGDTAVLQRISSEGLLPFLKKKKNSRRHIKAVHSDDKENFPVNKGGPEGSGCDLQSDDEVLQVVNAYLEPRCHSADSEVVQSVLALNPFDRSQLQQICAKYFEWPPEKTDEYILPKIAERELRRFSNLRSASSKVGLQVPLDMMPIKCHIIKERKAQGRHLFEVSWEGVHGLEKSIVPADLVQSACPEKVMEFQERRAQRKKPNNKKPTRRKVENITPSSKELDSKLQALLLELDQENTTVLNRITMSNPTDDNLQLNTMSARLASSENEVTDLTSPSQPSRVFSCVEDIDDVGGNTTEVIDLLTPPPRGIGMGKCQNEDDGVIILLSDSESDMFSPDHIKKGIQLTRSCITSIR